MTPKMLNILVAKLSYSRPGEVKGYLTPVESKYIRDTLGIENKNIYHSSSWEYFASKDIEKFFEIHGVISQKIYKIKHGSNSNVN